MTAFIFDDRSIDFLEGQTVGAALITAGIYSWRVTRRASGPAWPVLRHRRLLSTAWSP